MPEILDTHDFPHGGRKGLEYDFEPFMDGQNYKFSIEEIIEAGSASADAFLGTLSRYANSQNMRVNKDVIRADADNPESDVIAVVIRARPKKVKEATTDGASTEPKKSGRPAKEKTAA